MVILIFSFRALGKRTQLLYHTSDHGLNNVRRNDEETEDETLNTTLMRRTSTNISITTVNIPVEEEWEVGEWVPASILPMCIIEEKIA